MNNQLPEFPSDEFFDFSDGTPVENETINEWIKECYEDLQEEDSYSSSRVSGNVRVEVVKHEFRDTTYYDVYVSQGYYNAVFHE